MLYACNAVVINYKNPTNSTTKKRREKKIDDEVQVSSFEFILQELESKKNIQEIEGKKRMWWKFQTPYCVPHCVFLGRNEHEQIC